MQAHRDQVLGLSHELASHADEQVSAITTFVLLHLGSLGNHLSSGMVHISLSNDGSGVRSNEKLFQVIDDHLVHA